MFVHFFDESIHKALVSFQDLISTMTNSKSITFIDGQVNNKAHHIFFIILHVIGKIFKDTSAKIPIGCAFTTLSDKCKLYILLKGIIDIEKEELKLKKKQQSLGQQIESLNKLMSSATYETKVPEEVRQKNTEKVTFFILFKNTF